MKTLAVNPNIFAEFTPSIGKIFELEQIAYDIYNEYRRRAGFGVRKEYDD